METENKKETKTEAGRAKIPVNSIVSPDLQRDEYCHTCGSARGIAVYRDSIGIHDIVSMDCHREMQRGGGRMYEESPQMLVHVGIWRNGGSCGQMFICDDCLRVGLIHARDKINILIGEG